MSGKFNMADYVDVAERIAQFHEKYPDGSLQSTLTRHDDGWLCRAKAYRTPEDRCPGVGHAFEPVPGKTPYTRDSEAMNAETSAWGRAIVALGFETKKIASANEVRARQEPQPEPDTPFKAPPPKKATKAERMVLEKIVTRLKDAGHINVEQLDSAAGGKFDIEGMSQETVVDLTERLTTFEANKAAA